ncbi:hypothetical protein V5R04_07200 [Jonesiaceae bacterium BS-20]|uniref:Uncharacterized protein n=1 Tax=Jonesiaceae bacterium BS-20 TaxID=3120821 RepID=A0AAU7E015_9MICO
MPADMYISTRPVLAPHDASRPGGRLLDAASLTMKLLKLAKAPTLGDINGDLSRVPAHVRLEEGQVERLREFLPVVAQIRVKLTRSWDEAGVTVAACLTCGRWMLVSSEVKTIPKKCQLTSGCGGVVRKASAAVTRAQ